MTETYESTTTRLTRQELGACALIEDLLPLYIEGEVSPSSRDIIVEHLARCERCAGFLAGAQTVRAQLRRDTLQRTSVITNRLPEQRAVGTGQLLAMLIAVLFCCAVGGVGSALGWQGMSYDGGEAVAGAMLMAAAFGLLLALTRSRGPLTLERLLALTGSCAVGATGTLPIVAMSDSPAAALLGLLLGVLGMVGVWMAVWRRVWRLARNKAGRAGGAGSLA